jgi:GNAT superfamily N-acetyltransferase
MAMGIKCREWNPNDLLQIQNVWLDYCRNAARSDMRLKEDSEKTMRHWLAKRFQQRNAIGFVAEADEAFAGFILGRIDDWESIPPVIESRRIGIVDALYVVETFRKQGIGGLLIDRATHVMKANNAIAIETIYDAWNDAAVQVWQRAGFAPWMVHAYRML